ncbi:RHS repeat domain-containing protein, partial [Paenibacillus wenxiniae]
KGESTLSVYSYQYDNNGNITSVTEQVKDGTPQTSTYSYDKLSRLTGVKRADGTETGYSYDLRGNRLTQKDTRDLPVEKAVNYRYDLQNTLISVTKDSVKTALNYLPDGLRWKKTNGSKVTQYSYNGANQVIGDQTSNGTISSYIRGDRVLVKKDLTNQKDYYYLYNGHGDVVQMAGTDGSLVNSYQYDEWGNLTQQKETVANEFKYAGETYDAETGLYYLKARYYDPNVGRFLNEDTVEGQIDNPLSLNIYSYVQGNPLRYTDPTGNLIQESYNDGGLRDLLQQAREQITSKSDPLYAKYKSTVIETYKHFIDTNRYNYLFDLTTGTSTYGNSAGKSDWAIAQLINAYQDYELAEYIATLSMGSLGGIGNSSSNGRGKNNIEGMPPIVQSRINISNDGFQHVLTEHFSSKNKSQFTISPDELRSILSDKSVVSVPITRTLDSADGVRYVREVNLGIPIGTDKFNDFKPTSTMTILTDKNGNLVTASPGIIK